MTEPQKGMFIFVVLGLFLGTIFDELRFFNITNPFYYCTTLLFFLFYGFCYNEKKNKRLILTSLGLAIILSSPLAPMAPYYQKVTLDVIGDYERLLSFLIAFPILIYVGHSFHYAYHRENTYHWHYQTLFSAVWDSFVLLITACVFAGIAKLLILMAAFLFRTVGNDLLWKAYSENSYIYTLVDSTLFFIGLGIAQQNHNIIHNLRFLLLRMMHFLLPLLALISIIYFLLYIVAMFQPQNTGLGFIPPEVLLSALVIVGIVFFNADFQTGQEHITYSSGLVLMLKLYRLVLLCICLILTYRFLRSYVLPVNFCLYLLVAVLYCLLYATTIFFSKEEQQRWITSGNQAIALFFLIALLILNNPLHPVNAHFGAAARVSPPLFGSNAGNTQVPMK